MKRAISHRHLLLAAASSLIAVTASCTQSAPIPHVTPRFAQTTDTAIASTRAPETAPLWDTMPDTWVATDALGRTTPTNAQVGAPRKNKTVAMFYFLTQNQHPTMGGPFNVTEILATHPEALNDLNHPAWGPLNSSHHWGQPLFGYYASDDEYVLAKHGQMLTNAGVDVVIFDVSNGVTYDKVYMTLCRVWSRMRQRGGRTPQIAFLAPFGNPGGVGTRTVRALWDNFYSTGEYSDLSFRWRGKPLIMAGEDYVQADNLRQSQRVAVDLKERSSLGQTFTARKAFTAVGSDFPTWQTRNSAMTLSLYRSGEKGTRGQLLASRRFTGMRDNAVVSIEMEKPLPPGVYYLEMSQLAGQTGWWSQTRDVYAGGRAFEGDVPMAGDRLLQIRYVGEAALQPYAADAPLPSQQESEALAQKIRGFFTFRMPIAPYNLKSPPAGWWSWLQIYPQAPNLSPQGELEEVSVGVGQNYNATVNSTAPMSFPGAFGRSYHNGALDTRPGAHMHGYNFAEQWRRALQLDPPLVFITGWNEWTAGRYAEWAGFNAPPVVFVDQFNREFSRDIEPEKGGHGDNYYYQLVENVRRYKGVRVAPPASPRAIKMDGQFADWKDVGPEFRDAIGDPARRDHIGYGKAGPYKNTTGRNDIVTSKTSYDSRNLYFYASTRAPITARSGNSWMLLFIDSDQNAKTGWLGYDFVLNRGAAKSGLTTLSRNIGGKYSWGTSRPVACRTRGNQIEIAVPRALLNAEGTPRFDFKWADNSVQSGVWSDFTLNGDAAPDERFNYRYTTARPARKAARSRPAMP